MNQSIDVLIKKHFWWVFFLILTFALFSHLDYLPLKFEEPRRGVVALEMEMSGNYLTPTINGEYYYNKPPIYNWILVGLFKVFNSCEDWVLRIPTVLSFLLIAFINYKVVRKKLGDQVAVLSSLFFITSTDLLFSKKKIIGRCSCCLTFWWLLVCSLKAFLLWRFKELLC